MDDEDWVHPSWNGDVEPAANISGLQLTKIEALNNWAVRLEFRKDGQTKVGSGFFINIPPSETSTAYHVIFTAAHNLSTLKGVRATELTIFYTKSQSDTSIEEYTVPPKDVYVNKGYYEGPKAGEPETDYGFIRLPFDPATRRGFGFSMKLSFEEYFNSSLYVSGFQDSTESGHPVLSSGRCLDCYTRLVEYEVKTQPGLSGSAVWVEYEGEPVAVAIHNNGPAAPGGGSRGARLTPELLIDAFRWLNSDVMQENVELHSADVRLKRENLYVSFQGALDFARVRLRNGTKFDVMPAQVIVKSKEATQEDSYALRVTGGDWVMFNPSKNEVVKTEEVKEKCFFTKDLSKKKPSTWTKIVVGNKDAEKFQLRVQGLYLKAYDEDFESSEVSFVPYPKGDKDLANRFWFS